MKYIIFVQLVLVLLIFSSCTKDSSNTNSQEQPSLVTQVVDLFEAKFGVHKGERRNHISGFCFTGSFQTQDSKIQEYSENKMFSEKPLQVIGRFSHKDGVKSDESVPGEYGMAFEIALEDGSTNNFSMNTLDFFPVKTPEGFRQLMTAKVSGKAEDLDKLKEDHPEYNIYKAYYAAKPIELKAYANHQFNSVNSFYFTNKDGDKTPVRWSFIPKNKHTDLDATQEINLFEETQNALDADGTLSWDMVVSIANEDYDINDASAMWTGNHETIIAGTLSIDKIMETGACEGINFDPLKLQAGIEPSDDPILKFRSPAYANAFARRSRGE